MKIDVDDEKFEILKMRSEEKGFESTEEYIDSILGQIVQKIKNERANKSDKNNGEIKEKLKDLGYKN